MNIATNLNNATMFENNWQKAIDASTGNQKDLLLLLQLLNFPGSIYEILPFLHDNAAPLSLDSIRDVLAEAGYYSEVKHTVLDTIPNCDLPTIGLLEDGRSVVITAKGSDEVEISCSGKPVKLAGDTPLTWLEIQPQPKKCAPSGSWFTSLLNQFTPILVGVLTLSFINAILAMALPLFTMSVYDFLIPSGSISGLVAVGTGAIIALGFIVVANVLRAKMLSQLAANISYHTSRAVFRRLVNSPSEYVLSTKDIHNIARLKDIDRIREFFGGLMVISLFDAPFVIVALAVIAWLSGWLVLVPIFGAILFAILGVYFNGHLQQVAVKAGKSSQHQQIQLRQALDGLVELREAKAHSGWLERYTKEAIRSARANFTFRMANSLQQTLGKFINMAIALATLMSGVYMVLINQMTTGGLIAVMLLIWRVTGPLHMAFLSLSRIRQYRQAVAQANAIVDIPMEQAAEKKFTLLGAQKPSFKIERLVYRYANDRDAALNGVSFAVEIGQKVAIVGPNGSGKSTLLACFSGLLKPLSGSVFMDGYDIRQFRLADYRQRVAFINTQNDFIDGTVKTNLKAAAPLASEEQICAALDKFAVYDYLKQHAAGLDTAVMTNGYLQLDTSVAMGIKLARAYLRDADVYLLDDLFQSNQHPVMLALNKFMLSLPPNKTLLFSTHDKNLMLQADRAIILERGTVAQIAELQSDETSTPTGEIGS